MSFFGEMALILERIAIFGMVVMIRIAEQAGIIKGS